MNGGIQDHHPDPKSSATGGSDDEVELLLKVEDYVRGQMHGAALDEFELRMMDDRHLQDLVDVELNLQRAVRAMGPGRPLVAAPRVRSRGWPVIAAAASVFLALGFLVGRFYELRSGGRAAYVGAAELLVLDTPRGNESASILEATAAPVVIEVPVFADGEYSLSFHAGQSPYPAFSFDQVRAGAGGMLRVIVAGSDLTPGIWQVRIGHKGLYEVRSFEMRQ
jgi:hypothetical protein